MVHYQYAITLVYIFIFGYLAYSDFKYNRIPNNIVIPAILFTAIINSFLMPVGWLHTLIGGGIGLGIALLFIPVGHIGGGDFKLLILIGVACGYPLVLYILWGSSLVALPFFGIQILLKKKKLSDRFPYGVLLGIACVIGLVINTYLG